MSSREMGSPMAQLTLRERDPVEEDPGTPSDQSEESTDDEKPPQFPQTLRDPDDVGAIPSNVPRSCTDVGWLLLYIAFSALAIGVGVYVWPLGKPSTLLRLADWQGEKCGYGPNENRTLLYFCPESANHQQLDMEYPICVDTCPQGELIVCPKNQNRKTTTAEPSSTSTENAYAHYFHSIKESNNGGLPYPPYPSDGAYEQYPPGHAFRYPFYQTPFHYPPPIYPPPIPTGTTWNPENNPTEGLPKSEKVTSVQSPVDPSEHRRILSLVDPNLVVLSDWRGNFTVYQVHSYTSAPFVDMICKPWVGPLERQVQLWIDKTPLVNTWATLINSYWPLLVAAGTGVVMSYVFMTLLRFRAAMLVRTGMVVLVSAPLITGLYYGFCWYRHCHCWASTKDRFTDGLVAVAGLVVGLGFSTITWSLREATDLAVECIEWSCKAVLETPSLKLEPLLALFCRAVVDATCLTLVTMILTCELEKEEKHYHRDDTQWMIPCQSTEQLAMLGVIAFWCLWTNWIITAISDFVIMYTTELWVFAGGLTPRGGHVPLCCLLRAYCTCFRYHLGSMVVGGLVVGVAQPFRITFGVVAFIVEFERNSSGILSCLCDCCVSAYFTHLEPYCRNAYMDLALNARCFQESAWHASMVNAEFMATVNILNGATWIFQLAGLGAITSLGNFQIWTILRCYPGFQDPYSPDFVQNPLFLACLGSVVSFVMAFPFMMIFDTVSDTILFAYIVQKLREEKDEVPTIYSRACGFVETVDDFIGLGCLDRRKKDYSMPTFNVLDELDEEAGAGGAKFDPGL
ncbi:unnamed protein product [Durusdinium trenchii]|uniref:Choline transporter-like protein 5 (Solute carrier family 44 member 5) n=2 Tax=Durusdinium trenchii TaxID=1381693 RepID=A0ABP0JP68_9DINO